MKTTFKFIIAVLSAIAVFASCQKELGEKTSDSGQKDGLRVITVQFDNPTKASLGSDGFTPKFADGDKIRVSNNTESKECEVSVSGDEATFTTDLTGNLTAIYPAAAAVFTGTGPITDPFFKVEASQDGDIAKAIIAKAVITDASSCATATFKCQTALFQITPPDGEKSFTVTSLKTVVSGARTGDAVAINTEGTTEAAKLVITVSNTNLSTFYVALKAGVNLSDLSFEYITDASHGAMKGIPTNDIKALASSSGKTFDQVNATAANTKYTINNGNWHPYVEIGDKKWATENIGVTDSDPYGTYFMWGETNGIKPSASSFSFPTSKYYTADNKSWTQTSGFAWANCPWTNDTFSSSNKNVFTKYTSSNTYASGTADNKTKLELADDAAYANWGGPWRMPTGWTESNADFTALAKAANASYASSSLSYNETITTGDAPSNQGVYYYNVSGKTVGVYFVDGSGNKLFFPAAGYGYGTGLSSAGDKGYYWSSSLDTDEPNCAGYLMSSSSAVYPQGDNSRYFGYSVRPVSD